MTDPERLLEGGGSDFERELLGSLANERPPHALSRRMRQGLVALGLLTSAKTSVAGIALIFGVVSVGAGGIWLARHHQVEVRAPITSAAPPMARSPALSASSPSAEPDEAPAPSAPARPSAAAAPALSAASDLREQILAIDRARAALRAGNSRGALAELAQYRKQFPRGQFAQEVTVLKIEALVQDGQMDGARSLAKQFLAVHPESPHVERIERLIGTTR